MSKESDSELFKRDVEGLKKLIEDLAARWNCSEILVEHESFTDQALGCPSITIQGYVTVIATRKIGRSFAETVSV